MGKGAVFAPAAHGSRAANIADPKGAEPFGPFRAGAISRAPFPWVPSRRATLGSLFQGANGESPTGNSIPAFAGMTMIPCVARTANHLAWAPSGSG